jgi:23S rRNA (cytosine1962-C5)-methyltransferase
VRFSLTPTGFGHLGLFPEQAANWAWLRQLVLAAARPVRLLNLFAYTGGTTLAVARRDPGGGGSPVAGPTRPRISAMWTPWAASCAGRAKTRTASGLGGAGVRWVVEDAQKYVKREVRRGRRYDLIVLDPPTFGRGPQGQVFKLERDLAPLLADLCALLSENPLGLLLTCHTPGIGAPVLANVLAPLLALRGGALACGESLQTGPQAPLPLPSGVYARWTPENGQP